jgi:hypothetical protein
MIGPSPAVQRGMPLSGDDLAGVGSSSSTLKSSHPISWLSHCDSTTRPYSSLHLHHRHAHTFARSLPVEPPSNTSPLQTSRDTQQWPTPSLFPSSTSSWPAPSPVSPRSWSCTLWMSSRLACKPHCYSTVIRVRARAFSRRTASKRYGQLTRCNANSQIQSHVPVPGVDHYSGMLDCIKKIVKNEGYGLFHDIHKIGTRAKN